MPTQNIVSIIVGVLVVAAIGGGLYLSSSKDKMVNKSESAPISQDTTAVNTHATDSAMMNKGEEDMDVPMMMALAQLGNSKMQGSVTLTPEGDKTEVSIMLTGSVKGESYPAHIHVGACPTPGAIKYPLTNIVDGKSVTLVSASVDEIWKSLPLALNVHKSALDIKTYVACGDLSTATGAKMEGDKMEDGKPAMHATGTMMKEEAVMHAGSYEAYAPEKIAQKSTTGHVVLYFHANWCPTCRALDADITAHLKDIPANLSILKVDYDASQDLKRKYGVTYQHTMVEVDANGTLIKKWSGSPKLADLITQVK